MGLVLKIPAKQEVGKMPAKQEVDEAFCQTLEEVEAPIRAIIAQAIARKSEFLTEQEQNKAREELASLLDKWVWHISPRFMALVRSRAGAQKAEDLAQNLLTRLIEVLWDYLGGSCNKTTTLCWEPDTSLYAVLCSWVGHRDLKDKNGGTLRNEEVKEQRYQMMTGAYSATAAKHVEAQDDLQISLQCFLSLLAQRSPQLCLLFRLWCEPLPQSMKEMETLARQASYTGKAAQACAKRSAYVLQIHKLGGKITQEHRGTILGVHRTTIMQWEKELETLCRDFFRPQGIFVYPPSCPA